MIRSLTVLGPDSKPTGVSLLLAGDFFPVRQYEHKMPAGEIFQELKDCLRQDASIRRFLKSLSAAAITVSNP